MPLKKLRGRGQEHSRRRSPVDLIINRRTLIEKLFVVVIALSLICAPFVGVNYDLSKYLPESAASKQGLDKMEDIFGYPGTARVMIGDVSLYQAKVYKDRIQAVDGVDMVMWADTTTDIYQSNLFLKYEDLEDYYRDGYAVMDVTFDEGDSSALTRAAIDEIEEICGDRGYYTGSAIREKALKETLVREIAMAMVMGVIMIAVVLCLTTNSWFEPILFLLVMGVAIVINMGTNIFLGTISFMTFSVAAILQLAIAMDYSIFLLHSFTRERQAGQEPVQAIANALRSSVSSILSSGATTVVGFIVLTLMRFSIGRDMGIVLAKGIVISLLTVLLLMPALILRWGDKIERSRHRSFMPSFDKFGKVVFHLRHVVTALVLLLIVPAFVAQGMNSFTFGNDALGSSPGTKSYEDDQLINQKFGRSNLMLALIPNDNPYAEKRLTQELEGLPYTKSVMSLASMLPDGVPEHFLPESMTSMLHKGGYARMMIYIKTASESPLAFDCTDEIQSIVTRYYPGNSYLVGVTPSTQDIKNVITVDYSRVNLLSLLGVALVIMLTFRSWIIPILVMIPIEVAIFLNMALPYLYGGSMIYMGYIIVSCLQLGATVDYSILMTNNYLDSRMRMERKEAAAKAVSMSALSILTSGSILTIVGYGLYFTSSVAAIGDMGRLVGRGALLSLVLVLCLLPALLVRFDKLIASQKRRQERLEKSMQIGQKEVRLSVRYLKQQRYKRFKRLLRAMRKQKRDKRKAERAARRAGRLPGIRQHLPGKRPARTQPPAGAPDAGPAQDDKAADAPSPVAAGAAPKEESTDETNQ